MLHVGSFLIGVKNLSQARSFYEHVFGMKFEEFRPPFAAAYLDGMEFNIEEDAPTREPGWAEMHIGGRKQMSFSTDDLEGFLDLVKKYGGVIVREPEEKPWGWKEALIADESGNIFLIEQELISSVTD